MPMLFPASADQTDAIIRALSHPIRKTIYDLLKEGPIRQSELAELLERKMGKRYGESALRYHLVPLERAGLVGRLKHQGFNFVYRSADFHLRIRALEAPEIAAKIPKTPEELKAELKRLFAERRRK